MRNALFHTPEHSQISINLQQNNNKIELTICDMGKGVAEEKISKIFDAFVRIDETRQNTKIPGYGLGLAIAKRAIELHHGTISAFNRPTGGLCIQVQLPFFES